VTVSFQTDIVPLFTRMDSITLGQGTLRRRLLVHEPASHRKRRQPGVSSGSMPPSDSGEEPWPQDKAICSERGSTAATSGSCDR
jgi:hypothetical protein